MQRTRAWIFAIQYAGTYYRDTATVHWHCKCYLVSRPRKTMTGDGDKSYDYEPKRFSAPVLSGWMLRSFAAVAERSGGVQGSLYSKNGFTVLKGVQLSREEPVFYPWRHPQEQKHQDFAALNNGVSRDDMIESYVNDEQGAASDEVGFRFTTIAQFHAAYREGKTTPLQVAQAVLAAVRASNNATEDRPALRAIVMTREEATLQAARQSAERWKRGEPLSILDGVPVACKNELDVEGFPTKQGTAWINENVAATVDCDAVARLKAAGAVVVGVSNMHEIGVGVTGANWNEGYGTCRNPYNLNHDTAGSSSGSASAVAAGLVPLAIGCDGGGSIRLPAAFCGGVGLKATFGRIDGTSSFHVAWTIGHAGAPDETDGDRHGLVAPSPFHTLTTSLEGLRVGVFEDWTNDVVCETTKTAFAQSIESLRDLGATIVPIRMRDIPLSRIAHTLTIITEMRAAVSGLPEFAANKWRMNPTSRIILSLAEQADAVSYIQAQRVRDRCMKDAMRLFAEECDVIVTPASGVMPPAYPNCPNNLASDVTKTGEVMKFAQWANFTGVPGITFPVAYDESTGVPIALQVMADHWREDLCLRVASAFERRLERQRPALHFDVLADAVSLER
ncbi:MAG: hypothetical protein MHM6MM_000284 [Cercozoa sp. M6MM]